MTLHPKVFITDTLCTSLYTLAKVPAWSRVTAAPPVQFLMLEGGDEGTLKPKANILLARPLSLPLGWLGGVNEKYGKREQTSRFPPQIDTVGR